MKADTQLAVLRARMDALEQFTVQVVAPIIATHPQRDELKQSLQAAAQDERTNALKKSFSDLAQRSLLLVQQYEAQLGISASGQDQAGG